MANFVSEKPNSASEAEAQPTFKGAGLDEKIEYNTTTGAMDAGKVDYDRTGAMEAEKIEHDMTVLQAVKAYPAASWWAFVMSSTIVSSCPRHTGTSFL
jgi:SP family general alpha glucoside:H+ symporter-like MFS transporter